MGVWGPDGPYSVTSQQSAELWGVLTGLQRARGPTNLFVAAGEANIALPEEQHIMRCLAHRLCWQGGHYSYIMCLLS